jgi:hypothetical protein
MPEESSITELLQRWSTGDPLALEALIPRVHGEHLCLQRESHEATAPTSLVHDLYLRLLEERKIAITYSASPPASSANSSPPAPAWSH